MYVSNARLSRTTEIKPMPVSLKSEKYEEYFRALFVGRHGSGKTIAANSWPGKTLDIDFDNRHTPLLDWYQNTKIANDEIYVEVIDAYNWWTKFKPLINDLITKFNPYQNVCVDSITNMSTTAVVMQVIAKGGDMSYAGKTDDQIKKAGVGKVTQGGIVVPTWDEFNGEAMLFSTFLDVMKNIKSNFFMTAHPVKRIQIAGDKGVKYESITTFGPKVESIIPSYFDNIWYFDYDLVPDPEKPGINIIRRRVWTQPSDKYLDAKSAIKGLPAVIDITDKSLYEQVAPYLKKVAVA